MYYLGQICGLIGACSTILQPQFRKREQILVCTIVTNGMNALNFALIGQAGSSVYLCVVAILQSLVAIRHERKSTPVATRENILFLVLYIGIGFYGMITADDFSWTLYTENLLELLPIIGALMLMLSIFAKKPQSTRFFLFLNGSIWLFYTAVIGATAFFSAAFSLISASVALWKYRRKD